MSRKITACLLALIISFSFAVTSFASLKGDVNGDGTVSSVDALNILEYSIGKTTAINTAKADVNNDGKINSSDALAVLQICVGIKPAVNLPGSFLL